MNTKQKSQNAQPIEASAQNAVSTIASQLEQVEAIKAFTISAIMALPTLERIKALKTRSEALSLEAKLKPINTFSANFDSTSITGSDILGHKIYFNSVNNKTTNTVELWRLCEKNQILEAPSFTRTMNTSLSSFEANKIKNLIALAEMELIEDDKERLNCLFDFYNSTKNAKFTRLPETITYIDNINLRVQGLKGNTSTTKRFKYFFESLKNDLESFKNITLYIETTTLKNVDVPFNAMNTILVYAEDENDKSLEILKTWLLYKGASKTQLETENI